MAGSLTLPGSGLKRFWSFVAGAGMIVASAMTIRHFFAANFPETIWEGSFCDLSAFFNCDSSAFSPIAHFGGVPMGWFGLFVGALVILGAIFPSAPFEKTNKAISILNAVGVLVLLCYSVFVQKSLCLLCSGYYLFSLLSFFLFWRYGIRSENKGVGGFLRTFAAPSVKIAVVAVAVLFVGAFGFRQFYFAKKGAQMGGTAANFVRQFNDLAVVGDPSFISPYWVAQATPRWEDAPIRIVEYADYLCPDCLFLHQQLTRLKAEFPGKINIAFQFFPLEAGCNSVVEKDLHPGACDLSLIAAYNPGLFSAVHEEIFANFMAAKTPEWREDLMKRYGLEAALTDPATRDMLQRIIATGTEYEKTSDKYSHGIRSTPTMIINGRMIIGTLPDAPMKAIFESLIAGAERGPGAGRFIENWVETKPSPKK
ncbi:MAG: thioredoxin domain-containing protein [Candidatus Aminicenantes bacterium]|nr:thioredoxin domain-containing protein [Candidatus Aminicenantes bacterium]